MVTVAIPTYNGKSLLEVALTSLVAQSFRDFRVVVVDDASSDGSPAWLRECWPEVEVVTHPTNLGVTAALNTCLRAGSSEFVVLLNNDMELDPDCLTLLVQAMREHPEAGSACPKLLSFADRTVLDGAGDTFDWGGTGRRRGHGERDVGQYDEPQSIFGACAGAAIYRRIAIDAVGPLDEDFFAFYEDVDWSFRAQLHGYGCRYVPAAVAYHVGSATLGQGVNDFMLYQNWRNAIFVVLKDYPITALLRYGHRFLLSQAHNFVWTVQTRRVHVFMRVWRNVLCVLPTVVRKRREVQRSRKVGLRDLERVIGVDA